VAVGVQNQADSLNLGLIVSVRGGVADVRFDRRPPPIFSVLHAGAESKVVVEVMAQFDATRVAGKIQEWVGEVERAFEADKSLSNSRAREVNTQWSNQYSNKWANRLTIQRTRLPGQHLLLPTRWKTVS
jgi:F0F1-type ATP synthase beta subunit